MMRLHKLLMNTNVFFKCVVVAFFLFDIEYEFMQVLEYNVFDAFRTEQLVLFRFLVDFLELRFHIADEFLQHFAFLSPVYWFMLIIREVFHELVVNSKASNRILVTFQAWLWLARRGPP